MGNEVATKKDLEISELALSLGLVVYDKTKAKDKNEIKKIKKLALTTDCYISSCNALSCDGKIVNVDHSGNRVAAITYGPEKVIIIVGKNKLVITRRHSHCVIETFFSEN